MPNLLNLLPVASIWIFFGGGAFTNVLFPTWKVAGCLSAPSLVLIGAYLVTAGYQYSSRKMAFAIWAGGVSVACLGVEIIGVATGWPFGQYSYGPNLGPKLAGVPLVMGIAWLELLLLAGLVSAYLCRMVVARPLATAAIITTCDLLLEPAAPKLGFWFWQGGCPPLQNFVAWFLISGLASLPFNLPGLLPVKLTRISNHLLLAQMVYFGSAALAGEPASG